MRRRLAYAAPAIFGPRLGRLRCACIVEPDAPALALRSARVVAGLVAPLLLLDRQIDRMQLVIARRVRATRAAYFFQGASSSAFAGACLDSASDRTLAVVSAVAAGPPCGADRLAAAFLRLRSARMSLAERIGFASSMMRT